MFLKYIYFCFPIIETTRLRDIQREKYTAYEGVIPVIYF